MTVRIRPAGHRQTPPKPRYAFEQVDVTNHISKGGAASRRCTSSPAYTY